jgi:hypothetical protein
MPMAVIHWQKPITLIIPVPALIALLSATATVM